jgi:hypothetical protein
MLLPWIFSMALALFGRVEPACKRMTAPAPAALPALRLAMLCGKALLSTQQVMQRY